MECASLDVMFFALLDMEIFLHQLGGCRGGISHGGFAEL